jgi:uncharacterized OsmC-like protein
MDYETLRARQKALKQQYSDTPEAALVTLRANGMVTANVTCNVSTHCGPVVAGLHPATGGDGTAACSGDMLLQALVACTGVTLSAVARAMGITIINGQIAAEGDLDFRGTLGVSKEVPVGFQQIHLRITLHCDATESQRDKL